MKHTLNPDIQPGDMVAYATRSPSDAHLHLADRNYRARQGRNPSAALLGVREYGFPLGASGAPNDTPRLLADEAGSRTRLATCVQATGDGPKPLAIATARKNRQLTCAWARSRVKRKGMTGISLRCRRPRTCTDQRRLLSASSTRRRLAWSPWSTLLTEPQTRLNRTLALYLS